MNTHEKHAKSHGIPMFGSGREDTTMKHVVLAVVGSIFSFIASIVWSPFANFFLSKDLRYASRASLPQLEYQNVLGFLLAPCLMLAYGLVAGNQSNNDRERKRLNYIFTSGCLAALVWINVYAANTIFQMPTEGIFPIGAIIVKLGVEIIHIAFSILFFALSKLAIQAGLYTSSQFPSINKWALWGSIAGAVVFSVLLIPFLLLFATSDSSNPTPILTYTDSLKVNAEIARRNSHNESMFRRWTIQADSGRQYVYTIRNPKNGSVAEYCKTTGRDGMVHYLVRKVYDKRKNLLHSQPFNKPISHPLTPIHIDSLHNREVAEKILSYSRKEISLKDLVEWAQYVLFDGSIAERDPSNIMFVIGRIAVADVPEFSLSEEMIATILVSLPYTPL